MAKRPGSIAARLSLLYLLTTLVLTASITTFLYWVLASNLDNEGNRFILRKIYILRSTLAESPDIAMFREEVEEESGQHFTRMYVRLLDDRGGVLLQTQYFGETFDVRMFPQPMPVTAAVGRGVKYTSASGSYLLLSAWSAARASPTPRLIQIALDRSEQELLLARYRRYAIAALAIGLLLFAGMGYVVARQGMRPLVRITNLIQRIRASRLHERIPKGEWPNELMALAGTFNEMLDRLEDSFKRLSQFSADLAHELRTPLNNLRGEAEVALSNARAPQDYRQVIESSLEEYGRLSRMIDGLLFLAHADADQAPLERSRFEARTEIESIAAFFEAVAQEQGVTVECSGKGTVFADRLLFQRVIGNLLSNALRYTPAGGRITLTVRSEPEAVVVEVADTGSGIEPRHLPWVFDRFYRADPVRTATAGAGLGLSIVRSIMGLHGGTAGIRSEPAQGTTVTLVFPLT